MPDRRRSLDEQGSAYRRSRHWCLPVLLFTALCLSSGAPAAQDVRPEYELKAAFVSKFPQFAEWPESALNNSKTFNLCVARPNPFGRALDALIAGEALRGRPLVARDITDPQAIDACQLLFVPALPASERKALLARAATRPILTVGDYEGFLDEGGIVNLHIVDGRVRFDINAASANRAGVRLSSQLLRLAVHVREGPS
jgi:hypothetical protein